LILRKLKALVSFVFIAALAVSMNASAAFAQEENRDVVIVRVVREGAPLYRRADGGSEIARTSAMGEEFARIDTIQGFYLIKDEVSGSFLYLDPLDGVLTTDIVDIPEPQAYVRAPDADWYWLEDSFFVIENEFTEGVYQGRYEPNINYTPRVDPNRFIEVAKTYMGTKYKWGGESKNGIDCSGLILQCLRDQGFTITHKASVQAKYGKYVSFDALKPGDVLFFSDKNYRQIGHTGIYLGGGKFIHAASSLGKVGISSLYEEYYYDHLVLARRY